MSIYKLTESELLEGINTAPGRVRTFLLHPEKETTPHSCTLFIWNGNLIDCLQFTARALKGGAGVKIVFTDDFYYRHHGDCLEWYAVCRHDHPEFSSLSKHPRFLGTPINSGLTLKISDSMEGDNGILETWKRFDDLYTHSTTKYQVNLDLSDLRPVGSTNRKGLEASGAESFLSIFEAMSQWYISGTITDLLKLLGVLNSVMRRGGYKKGIVTSAMDYRNPFITEYLQTPLVDIQGSHKKAVILDDGVLANDDLVDAIARSRNAESTFIEKFHPHYPYVSTNVCEGIELGHKGTCLIWRVNLGKCRLEDIRNAFSQATLNLCELHTTWRDRTQPRSDIYATLVQDRQIAVDVMGLANYLRINGIKYAEFIQALEHFLDQRLDNTNPDNYNQKAVSLVFTLYLAYQDAKLTADNYMRERGLPPLDRIFTVEPAQNHSYETTDIDGHTTCRGIFAPYGQTEERLSDTEINRIYYHGDVEIAAELGPELHKRLCQAWQRLMDTTGRSHTISQDTYEPLTRDRLVDFLASPSKSLYYEDSQRFNQKYLSKDIPIATCGLREGECESCAG